MTLIFELEVLGHSGVYVQSYWTIQVGVGLFRFLASPFQVVLRGGLWIAARRLLGLERGELHQEIDGGAMGEAYQVLRGRS